jgi:hypothetical protein
LDKYNVMAIIEILLLEPTIKLKRVMSFVDCNVPSNTKHIAIVDRNNFNVLYRTGVDNADSIRVSVPMKYSTLNDLMIIGTDDTRHYSAALIDGVKSYIKE